MTTEYDAMPYDATLLSDVISQHNITVPALAMRSGYDDKSIYRYLSGERTVPSTVIRAAFELTLDMRLVGLVSGMIPVSMMVAKFSNAKPPRIPPLDQLIPETCNATKSAAEALQYIARILADSKIDATDKTAIENYKRHSAAAQRCLSLVDAAVSSYSEKVA